MINRPNVIEEYIKNSPLHNIALINAEPFSAVNKKSILYDTTNFNNQDIQSEETKTILVKLIYLLNQGVSLKEKEVETLFFSVTKLFSSKQLELRRLIYKCLKELKVPKYIHMVMQSIIKDLNHSNLFIRKEALRFISNIREKQFIGLLERYVQEVYLFKHIQSIMNKNIYISTTALIVAINISSTHPNIVKMCKSEIQTQLISQNTVNYHALILLNEIDQNDKKTQIDNVKLLNLNQSQLVNLQILKLMQQDYPNSNLKEETQLIMQFLQQSSRENQYILFLECFKCLLQKMEITNQPIITQFKKIIHPDTDLIILYRTINTIHYLITNFKEYKLRLQELRPYVKSITLVDNIGLASKAILTYLLFDENKKASLKKLLKNSKIRNKQQSFLEGLFELVNLNQNYGQLVFKALKQKMFEYSRDDLRRISIKIIYMILHTDDDLNTHEVLKFLFKLPKSQEDYYQELVAVLICQVYLGIEGINFKNASNCFKYLKKEFETGSDDFDNIYSRRHQEMEKNLLQIIEKSKKAFKIKMINYIHH